MSWAGSFGVAFWLGFVAHALTAEAYLAIRPQPRRTAVPALG
ncbi:MAG TPA: hypothetical protein VJ757_07380 [Pseudonocardiaceae bacterium]|nr:hypothetical protein [Pseudonocardiaceae bacterium]